MHRQNFIKRIIVSISIITGFVSCEKYNDEIFNDDYKKVYGEWTSYKKCGGFTGDCYNYDGETLKIIAPREFEIADQQGNYTKGYIKVISQDINGLRVRFEEKKGKLPLFSTDELLVVFSGSDTILFNEGCCDRFSFEFIKKK
jgi:hypothetical protein